MQRREERLSESPRHGIHWMKIKENTKDGMESKIKECLTFTGFYAEAALQSEMEIPNPCRPFENKRT